MFVVENNSWYLAGSFSSSIRLEAGQLAIHLLYKKNLIFVDLELYYINLECKLINNSVVY